MTDTNPAPSTLQYQERPRSTFWDKFIAIVALVFAAGSFGYAAMNGSILTPSWLRLTGHVVSHPQRAVIIKIWISSTLTMLDLSVGATLAVVLAFAAARLLQGAAGATRLMRRCAIARPIAAFMGAVVMLAFDNARSTQSALERIVWWSLLRTYTWIVSISLVTSVILLVMLHVNDARKLRLR